MRNKTKRSKTRESHRNGQQLTGSQCISAIHDIVHSPMKCVSDCGVNGLSCTAIVRISTAQLQTVPQQRIICTTHTILYIYTYTHTRTYLLTHSHMHSFFHSFLHLIIHCFIHSFIHSFTGSLIHSLVYSLIHSLVYSLIHFDL